MTNYSDAVLQLNPSLRASRKRNADAAAMRAALAMQLYDDWHGHYMLQRLDSGAYIDVRQLSRDEAMTYRTAGDEVLRLEWPQ